MISCVCLYVIANYMRVSVKIFIFLFCLNLYAQKGYFNLDKIKISESALIENKFKAGTTPKYKTILSGEFKGLAKKSFRRIQSGSFPPSIVNYYYSINDSIVDHINFNWMVNEDIDKLKKIEKYNLEFDKLVKSISKQVGEPKPNQGKIIQEKETFVGDESIIRNERRVTWEYKNCKITLLLVWAENHGQSLLTMVSWEK